MEQGFLSHSNKQPSSEKQQQIKNKKQKNTDFHLLLSDSYVNLQPLNQLHLENGWDEYIQALIPESFLYG